jgi:hypothetical protein
MTDQFKSLPKSRKEARALGVDRFFTGRGLHILINFEP